MIEKRRSFIQKIAGLGLASLAACKPLGASINPNKGARKPVILSTWDNQPANNRAWEILSRGGRALDAVEQGVMITEADPNDTSVGYGGFPDRDGNVTLDACIMDEKGRCGAVAYLQHIMHPIQIARLVMDKTPHWMLVGDGALEFALAQGFKKENLLTPKAEAAWREWLKTSNYKPISPENHDTIGMVALDQNGQLSGACTTSGAAWKMKGRVGDSPIIGAGLYVDNEVGAASATGLGEMVVRACGSHSIIEFMRQGNSPEMACKKTLERIIRLWPEHKGQQLGLLAIDNQGNIGGYGLRPGYKMTVTDESGTRVVVPKHLFEWD